MNSSAALLSILLALGLAVVGVFWGLNERNVANKAKDEEVSAIQRQSQSDFGSLENKLENSRAEVARLEDENRNLRRELDIERDGSADLIRQKERLELRLANLRDGDLPGDKIRDWTDDELDRRKSSRELTLAIRELPLKRQLRFRFADEDGMREALANGPNLVSPERATMQARAFAAMGFVSAETDVRARMLDLLEGQLGAAFYPGGDVILFNGKGTTNSVNDRTSLAVEIVRALQDQHFDLFPALEQWPYNDDAKQALWSVAVGDSSLVKIRFQLQDNTPGADQFIQSATKMTREQFERIPSFLREYYLFPFSLGDGFCQKLHEDGRWKRINEGLSSPPQSTAEILHPELYMSEEPFRPERYHWDISKLSVAGVMPIWNNVAGELGIALLLNQSDFLEQMAELGQPDILDMPELVSKGIEHFSARDGSKAAAGWNGDRYLVYPNADGEVGTDHVYWRTKWRSAEDAEEFADAITRSLAFRRGDKKPAAGQRYTSVRLLEGNQVRVIDSATREFGEALVEKFPEAAGQEGKAGS
ncbi:MAG: hypothetical protein GY899_17925 [Verrucomicrobiaceae bacterium]|nr:hypothetical protein [Verrucomicrobiaceae bacterium]